MLKIILLSITLLQGSIGFTQETIGKIEQDGYSARILKHYLASELDELKQNDTEKYNAICYYLLRSYQLEFIDGVETDSFDSDDFDITFYERYRHQSITRTKVDWKKGIKITLIPIDELEYKLPIHTKESNQLNEEDYGFGE